MNDGKKDKSSHLHLPHKLTRTTGADKKQTSEKFLGYLSKLFKGVDTLRFKSPKQGSIRLAEDGALELDITSNGTPFQGAYRSDGIVTIGADRETVGYPFSDVINYRYTKAGVTLQEYDHWPEADSIDNVEPFQYVYYEFSVLSSPDSEGNNILALLKAADDYPTVTADETTRYVVMGRTGDTGVWYQFHKGDIELDFAVGGGEATTTVPWRASFGAKGGDVLETWDVAADAERPAVIPDILYAVDGVVKNSFVQVSNIDLGLSNYGPDEVVEPVPETFERTLSVGQTHYYWAKFTDAYNSALAVAIQPVTTTKPDITTAPSGEVWRILWEVTATSETYPPDGPTTPRTGTKYAVTQVNEDIIDFTNPVTQIWAKLTDGTLGALIGDVYDNRSAAGTPISTGVSIDAPEIIRGTLPTNKTFPGELVDGSTYNIYPDSIY